MAPGSANAAGALVAGAIGGACVGREAAMGILTNCSLMNSFNLNQIPELSVTAVDPIECIH